MIEGFQVTRRQAVLGAAASAFALATAARTGAFAALPDHTYAWMTARPAIRALRAGRTTARDYAEALMARAEALAELNAFISQDKVAVRDAADAVDKRIRDGEDVGPLWGLPFCLKDNINTVDMPTTGGTVALKGWYPTADALVTTQLRAANGVLIGKTNMHELAFGITSNNPAWGAVRNPYVPAAIPGGSSGGTAAAVAAGLAPVGLGSDTGGSCRIPAALCGVVGFRPTLGRYSQAGIVPISSTRDTAGPLARTVDDVMLIDQICAIDKPEITQVPLDGVRIGVPRAFFYDNLDAEVSLLTGHALSILSNAGAELVEVDVPNLEELNNAVSFPIALYEVLREMSAYLYKAGNRLTVSELVSQVAGSGEQAILGSQMGPDAVPAEVYRQAISEGRPKLIAAYENYFADNELAALVVPTTPLPARPIGQDQTVELNGEQVPTFFTYIRNTDPPSNAGVPCLSVPAGITGNQLPVGVEFVGPSGSDARLLGIGRAFEKARGDLPPPQLGI